MPFWPVWFLLYERPSSQSYLLLVQAAFMHLIGSVFPPPDTYLLPLLLPNVIAVLFLLFPVLLSHPACIVPL